MSTQRQKSVFLTPHEQRRYRRHGVAEGAAAIKAVSPERKPGKTDSRDHQERLMDLLCSLRQWAASLDEEEEVSFYQAVKDSERHFMIESGQLAENYRDT